MFVTHPMSWKLKDSQRGSSHESIQHSTKTIAEIVILDSDCNMDLYNESISDGFLTRDQLLDRYQKKPLVASFLLTKSNAPIATVDVVPVVQVVRWK